MKKYTISQEVLDEANKVSTLQSELLNLSSSNVNEVASRLKNLNLYQFLRNVFITAEYRPFEIPHLVSLCSKVSNLKPLILQTLSNPRILNLEQMYFISKCRDAGIISNDEVKEAVEGKIMDEEIFKSCFFNDKSPELIPLEGEDIEKPIHDDDPQTLEKLIKEKRGYQIDYRIPPSMQFGCHFLRNQPTLIQYAAFCGSVKVVKYLLEHGANLDLKDLNGRTLAQFAVAGGNKEIIALFKERRVEFIGTMKYAVRFHRNELFEYIEDDPIPILHHCTASNNVELVLKCLENGSDINQPDKLDSNTPIGVAAEFNALDVLHIYMNIKNVNVNAKNKYGSTALHIASKNDFIEFVRVLLTHELIQPRLTDEQGKMALHVAAENGHIDVVQLFLENGCVTVNSRTNYGATPLHMAIYNGEVELAHFLLTVNGVDIEATTLTDETPIHFAAQHNRVGAIELLLASGADPNVHDKDGWTPLHYATQNVYMEALQKLLLSEKIDVNARNRAGWTPLHIASKMGNAEIVEILLATNQIKINEADNDGWTALHFASKTGIPEVVASILKYPGIEINKPDKAGWTALHDAVKYQNHQVVEMLLSQPGIDVNARTLMQWVPLHIAYLNHDQVTKDLLLSMPGILKDPKDSEGRSPEDLGKIPVFGGEMVDEYATMVYFNGA